MNGHWKAYNKYRMHVIYNVCGRLHTYQTINFNFKKLFQVSHGYAYHTSSVSVMGV